MPVFHTRTIESILEPVAQQVRTSRILFMRISMPIEPINKHVYNFQTFGYCDKPIKFKFKL